MGISGEVGFLGFGNMGQAIAKGLVRAECISADRIRAFDINPDNAQQASELGGVVHDSAIALAQSTDVLVLAPKPQDMASVLDSIQGHARAEALIISVAAGISIAFIQERLGPDTHVARVMPNTPAFVGAGASGVALSATCTDSDGAAADAIFNAIGITERVPEASLDAVTALSGSGPAYFFAMVEACVKAGVGLGLREDQATRLAGQTFYGAGLLLKESGESASTLRERVTSKGGTTEAALNCFQERDLEGTVSAAMTAAATRSMELGQ